MRIRHYVDNDANLIAELYNAHPENPNPVAGGITGEQLRRELEERGTSVFFVAEDQGRVVATFGLFSNVGRLTAAENELFADMFFVAPSHRRGALTGQLFTTALMWMIEHGLEVLRLTVNPANRDAFRIYRRVGCISRGRTRPGADGSIELYCYFPLVLKRLRNQITAKEREYLPELTAVGSIMAPLDQDLSHDVVTRDGRPTVQYRMTFGPMTVEASIDTDLAEVLKATVSTPDGCREIPLRNDSASGTDELGTQTTRRWGDRTISVLQDGTVTVHADSHYGPLISLTWPNPTLHRTAGWRGGPCNPLSIVDEDGRIILEDARSGVSCQLSLSDDLLITTFLGKPGQQLRLFQQTGLRLAKLDAEPREATPIRQASVGLGVAVRDSTQMSAAGLPLTPGTPVRWTEDSTVVELSGCGDTALVTSSLVDRRIILDNEGRATLITRISNNGSPTPHRNADASNTASPQGMDIRLEPRVGGVVRWRHAGASVLKCPYPRLRRFKCNPSWSAGMWVTREGDRHDREMGMGWGLPHPDWVMADDTGMFCPSEDIVWALDPSAEHCNWNIDISTSDPTGELVLWLTPAVTPGARIRLSNHGEVETAFVEGDDWQRWTNRLGVALSSGRWLCLEAPLTQEGFPELIVRSTGNDLLIGCVTRASAYRTRWRIALLEDTSGLVGERSYLHAVPALDSPTESIIEH